MEKYFSLTCTSVVELRSNMWLPTHFLGEVLHLDSIIFNCDTFSWRSRGVGRYGGVGRYRGMGM